MFETKRPNTLRFPVNRLYSVLTLSGGLYAGHDVYWKTNSCDTFSSIHAYIYNNLIETDLYFSY